MGGVIGKDKSGMSTGSHTLMIHKNIAKSKSKILMFGLYHGGKSTILEQLVTRTEEIIPIIPTIGFIVESAKYKNHDIIVFDVGGADKIRPMQKDYYLNIKSIIFVIDSIDQERMELSHYGTSGGAVYQFHKTLREIAEVVSKSKANKIRILFFANKQDSKNAMSLEEIMQKMDLQQVKNEWLILSSCAITKQGIDEGFEWSMTGNYPDSFDEGKSWYSSQTYKVVMENKKKSILFISGCVRNIDNEYKLHISVSITALIHTFYVDVDSKYDRSYKFYG